MCEGGEIRCKKLSGLCEWNAREASKVRDDRVSEELKVWGGGLSYGDVCVKCE